jgi:predicted nuclease of predicted toxin-antitoxin system
MRLLLDQGVPRSTAALLRDVGHDVKHTSEIGLAEAEDSEILEKAAREGRIIVTLDADFHVLLALSGAKAPSVIRNRIEGLRGGQLSELLQTVLRQCQADLDNGAVVSVQPGRVRVRRLPIK